MNRNSFFLYSYPASLEDLRRFKEGPIKSTNLCKQDMVQKWEQKIYHSELFKITIFYSLIELVAFFLVIFEKIEIRHS